MIEELGKEEIKEEIEDFLKHREHIKKIIWGIGGKPAKLVMETS